MKEYDYEQKKKLANRISKIRNKKDLCKIFEIINEVEKCPSKESNKKLFMMFHDLKNDTYAKIENFLKTIKAKKITRSYEIESTETPTNFKPYMADEFPSQKNFTPKLKFSNREKNLIKRKFYDEELSKNSEEVVYTTFDVNSEKN